MENNFHICPNPTKIITSGNLHNHLGSFFHRLYGHEFITPVKVQPTGENIGTRQSFERQLRSIGSATYRLHHRNNIYGPHSLGYQINDMHHRFDLLTHIIVLVVYFDTGTTRKLVIYFTS